MSEVDIRSERPFRQLSNKAGGFCQVLVHPIHFVMVQPEKSLRVKYLGFHVSYDPS